MLLSGKKGLVLNVTNEYSIGWAIAKAMADHGAHVGVGAQNEKMEQRVRRLIGDDDRFSHFIIDFSDDAQLDQLAIDVKERMGNIDFLVHSAAFANKDDLQGRFIDSSREGFSLASDISAFSLVRLCRVLEDVINDDGSIMCLSYLGSVRACLNYNIMGVAKAALECAVRYLAAELGPKGIRVHAISPGPLSGG
jgi:enoyl-[acyl-carrier protein] reductase I